MKAATCLGLLGFLSIKFVKETSLIFILALFVMAHYRQYFCQPIKYVKCVLALVGH
jgi:hypothetical protein